VVKRHETKENRQDQI